MSFCFQSHAEHDTVRLAQALAACLPCQATVALVGTLGAGKSFLVRSFAACCGIDPECVVSPTFSLWQTYQGTRTIHHLDAYRVVDDDEFLELGVEEAFEQDAVVFIEWADRIANCLPNRYFMVTFELAADGSRAIRIDGRHADDQQVIACIQAAVASAPE